MWVVPPLPCWSWTPPCWMGTSHSTLGSQHGHCLGPECWEGLTEAMCTSSTQASNPTSPFAVSTSLLVYLVCSARRESTYAKSRAELVASQPHLPTLCSASVPFPCCLTDCLAPTPSLSSPGSQYAPSSAGGCFAVLLDHLRVCVPIGLC